MSVRPPSLRSLAAFEAAARHQSFAKAAAELSLSNSAISHGIRHLEDRLGQQLFRRKGRHVALTRAGKLFAERIVQGMAMLNSAFETRPWAVRLRLVVAMPTYFAQRFLVEGRLAAFAEQHPDYDIDLRSTADASRVRDGDVDIAVCFGAGPWNGLSTELLIQEHLCPAAAPTYRHGRLPRSPAEVLAADLIDDANCPWLNYQDKIGAGGLTAHPQLVIEDYDALMAVAMRGAGVMLARVRTSGPAFASGALVSLLDQEIEAEAGYWLIWNDSSAKRAAVAAFRGWLKQELLADARATVRAPQREPVVSELAAFRAAKAPATEPPARDHAPHRRRARASIGEG